MTSSGSGNAWNAVYVRDVTVGVHRSDKVLGIDPFFRHIGHAQWLCLFAAVLAGIAELSQRAKTVHHVDPGSFDGRTP